MTTFVSQLRERNVLRVAAAYALVAWILIEAGSVLLPTFGAPEWFFKFYVIAVVSGFVVTVIMSWVFEITGDGVKLERDIDRTEYEPQPRGRMNVLIIALLVVALGVSITFNVTGLRNSDTLAPVARDSIAVLPFESLGDDSDNELLVDGLTEDITTGLTNFPGLFVIAANTTLQFKDSSLPATEIGER